MHLESNSETFDKVTVFVVRRRGASKEILTFLHPLAGRQIPAGSVELGELPVDAARREVIEETGFDSLINFTALGKWIETLEEAAVALIDNALHDAEGVETDLIRRGHRVRIERDDGNRLLVRRLLYDFNVDPPAELPVALGWANARDFATRIRRSFFLASAHDDGRLSWVQHADGHDFCVEWRSLDHELILVAGQDEWLAAHFNTLQGYVAEIAK